jgi:hypothetical protein
MDFPTPFTFLHERLYFIRRLFKGCPEAKVLFGFPISMDPDCMELLTSKRFKLHGVYLIQMLDSAVNLYVVFIACRYFTTYSDTFHILFSCFDHSLGPDIELLTEIMTEMGKKHTRYGVKPAYFPLMGVALLQALQEMLGKEKFSDDVAASWRETYDALADCIIDSMDNA